MLLTHQEIKEYVVKTIANPTSSKARIQAVLKRYQEWLKKDIKPTKDNLDLGLEVFKKEVDNTITKE